MLLFNAKHSFLIYYTQFFFRPFSRRLPEFKFWLACVISTVVSIGMTFFSIFDIPVFWPLLVLYFLLLFFTTMNKQIAHMIKYRYIPFSWGKTTYANAGIEPNATASGSAGIVTPSKTDA